MKSFSRDNLNEILSVQAEICLTFYIPVQQVGADTRQGSVILKKMLRRTEDKLREKGQRPHKVKEMLAPLEDLLEDTLFWEHQMRGLAIFSDGQELTIWRLPIEVEELSAVDDRFVIRPLLPMLVEDGEYYILALGRGETSLFKCSRTEYEAVKVDGLPDSMKEIYQQYDEERQLQHYTSSNQTAAGSGAVYHGGRALKDNEKQRVEEYFRKIDASLTNVLTDPGTPLVLACVDYLYPLYKNISHAGMLMAQHISGSPDISRPELLLQSAWPIVGPYFARPKDKAWQKCQQLQGTKRVIADLRHVYPALSHGRVETLFLNSGHQVYGFYNPDTNEVKFADPDSENFSRAGDLLDKAAVMTLQSSGQVFVMEQDMIPPENSCLAVLRY